MACLLGRQGFRMKTIHLTGCGNKKKLCNFLQVSKSTCCWLRGRRLSHLQFSWHSNADTFACKKDNFSVLLHPIILDTGCFGFAWPVNWSWNEGLYNHHGWIFIRWMKTVRSGNPQGFFTTLFVLWFYIHADFCDAIWYHQLNQNTFIQPVLTLSIHYRLVKYNKTAQG